MKNKLEKNNVFSLSNSNFINNIFITHHNYLIRLIKKKRIKKDLLKNFVFSKKKKGGGKKI